MDMGLLAPNRTPIYDFCSSGHLWDGEAANGYKESIVLHSHSAPPQAPRFTEVPPSGGKKGLFQQLPKAPASADPPPLLPARLALLLLAGSSSPLPLKAAPARPPRARTGVGSHRAGLRWGPFALMPQLYSVICIPSLPPALAQCVLMSFSPQSHCLSR